MKLLVEMLNFSLLNDVAGKVTSSLAIELDKRLKKSLLGDEDYKLGDATKRTIANAVQSYTGKGACVCLSCFFLHAFMSNINPNSTTFVWVQNMNSVTAAVAASGGGRGRARKRLKLYNSLASYHSTFLELISAEYQMEVSCKRYASV